jgi:ATP-dependent RNA helicase DDX31/DBP7
MDDDGFVLNIAEDIPLTGGKHISKKGGRWTERVKAKHLAKRIHRPESDNVATGAAQHDDEPPTKRLRTERKGQIKGPAGSSKPTGAAITPNAPSKPTQFISSLFTSNPKVEVPKPTPKAVSLKPDKPSNAPLTDSSTFQGLGLNPLITSHLSSKMNISKPTAIQRSVLSSVLSASPDLALRDVFIQSQTGSGKTLSFLLPIIQDLLPLSSHSYIDRSIGTLAVIIAPTRELAKQISDVLEALLKLRLRPEGASIDDESTTSLTRWLVSGLLTGGSTKAHEKSRLRKGLPILVATPGRLLDHLQNTSALNIGKCRWLVLDEADRLMELGFEETITGIIRALDGRRKLALKAIEDGKSMEVGGWDWERQRRTILCSATIREDVQKLAGTTLSNPLMIKAVASDPVQQLDLASPVVPEQGDGPQQLTPPSQLSQKYVIVPLKLRLVTLIALLRSIISKTRGQGTRVIVFLSCTDSVDFHWNMLNGTSMEKATEEDASESSDEDEENPQKTSEDSIEAHSDLLPGCSIYRLHGSLATVTRLASLKQFLGGPRKTRKNPKVSTSSVLLCTSVASRGLDLPLVQSVIQCDLPTEGGATEYVHRIGRTARAGKGGEAWSFVAPSEKDWVKWVEAKMQSDASAQSSRSINLECIDIENVLCSGFNCHADEYEDRATQVQLSLERWVLRRKENGFLAQRAYQSHMRAYATHPSDEKHMFHIRNLHIGHLAKAFALRDAPTTVSKAQGQGKNKKKAAASVKPHRSASKKDDWDIDHSGEAERRMQEVVRKQGRLSKKGGMMMSAGNSDFQVPDLSMLQKMVGH